MTKSGIVVDGPTAGEMLSADGPTTTVRTLEHSLLALPGAQAYELTFVDLANDDRTELAGFWASSRKIDEALKDPIAYLAARLLVELAKKVF